MRMVKGLEVEVRVACWSGFAFGVNTNAEIPFSVKSNSAGDQFKKKREKAGVDEG